MEQIFVDVILPLPLSGYYTYILPEAYKSNIEVGCRVIVPFGMKKYYTAVIVRIHGEAPVDYEVKEIIDVLDTTPLLLPVQLKFWEWIANYYLCTEGEVYKAALPSGLKLESETKLSYNPEYEATEPLSEKEQKILDLLSTIHGSNITQLEKVAGIKNIHTVVRSLLQKGAITVQEEMKQSYKPKLELQVRLTQGLLSEEALKYLFSNLSRAPKQLTLLMTYLRLAEWKNDRIVKEVSKKELLEVANVSSAVLNGMIEKNILEVVRKEIGRLNVYMPDTVEINPLNEAQQKAHEEILMCFKEKNVCLLHGVTSSGKTEVYIQLIQETIKQGKQVLYLLPEIALTTQITERLKRVFGARLGIYHSKFPDAERVEMWHKQLVENSYDILLGARSSIFLPFRNLGLIIVDEEHENTYKQQDPAPRYNARNAAIVLASMYQAKVLLGTATPSIESYYNAQQGKYGLVTLKERYQDIQLPEVLPVDVAELTRKKRMAGYFSPFLIEQIKNALERNEQVILFQNRRGFAPMMECRTCGWVPKCKNCDVSLTYHKGMNQLTCHYCGYTYQLPRACPACEGTEIINRGFGTEKVEDDIRMIFPQARIARMDLDTTRTRNAYEKIINDFQRGKVDILIGTQMVSKGLDFDHVSVVGILNADSMLNFPDFRAHERAYQLMAQVAGRAGRKNKRGLVVLQTRSMDYPVIHNVMANDYEAMYESQLAERQLFRYPPYYRLIYVYLKSPQQDVVEKAAHTLAQALREVFGDRVLGPDNPPVGRIQRLFIKKIMLKVEQTASIEKIKKQLLVVHKKSMQNGNFNSLKVYYDVDPM